MGIATSGLATPLRGRRPRAAATRRWLAAAAAGATLLGLAATSAAGPTVAIDHDRYPMTAERIGDGLWAVTSPHSQEAMSAENGGWISNSAFLVTDDGVLVFDTGSSEAIGAALRRTIRQVTDKPIRWIVNSHPHGDHWMGNAALAGEDTAIIATPATRRTIREQQDEWLERFEEATGERPEVVLPERTIEMRTRERLGGTPIEWIPLGQAHATDDLVAWLPEQEAVLAGDVVFEETAPSTFDADIQQWLDAHETLLALEPETVVAGHGGLGTSSDIEAQQAYFQTLWSVTKEGWQAGHSYQEITPEVRDALAERGLAERLERLEERLGRSVNHTYLQVEAALF